MLQYLAFRFTDILKDSYKNSELTMKFKMNQYISGEKSNKKNSRSKRNKRKSIFLLEKNLTEECVNVVA